jgi:hypothetical protein
MVDPTPQDEDRWCRVLGAIAADLRVVCAVLAVTTIARAFSIWWERASLDPDTGLGTIAQATLSGLRLDMQVAITLVVLSLALSLTRLMTHEPTWTGRLRRGWRAGILIALIILTPLATAIDLAFLGEYGHRFDAGLFAAGADDPGAIARSIWSGWPVLRILAIALPLGAGLAWLALLASRPLRERAWWFARLRWPGRILLTMAIALTLIGLARGSLTRQEWNMQVAATGTDLAVDRLIPSPWKSLHRAWIDHRRIQRQNGVDWFLPNGDVRAAAHRTWGGAPTDLDAATARSAAGGRPTPPRHVVLVVLESYGAWALDEAWRPLGLAEGMRQLGTEGQLLTRFISAGDQTMKSFGAVVTGVPYAMVELPDLPTAHTPFPTSLPAAFKRLGYRTRFCYAGYASWQRIGEFMLEQGFDEVLCGGNFGLDPARDNEWGLPDTRFLPGVLEHLDDDAPSLTVILTVGNHAPFDHDVTTEGWTMQQPPAAVASACDDAFNAHELGHFWLMDREFTRFVRAAANRLPGLLLAATGDHYGRRYPNHRPDLASRTLVPLLLWGPGLDRPLPADQAGAHIDIGATLIERCAPPGFAYHSFGRDLLAEGGPHLGMGQTVAVGPHGIAGLKGYSNEVQGDIDAKAARAWAADLTGLGWWRAKQGPAWPSPARSSH